MSYHLELWRVFIFFIAADKPYPIFFTVAVGIITVLRSCVTCQKVFYNLTTLHIGRGYLCLFPGMVFLYSDLYHDSATFPLIYVVYQFRQGHVKGGAYN